MRLVFLGTPEFAIPSLALLMKAFGVVGVVTQPDRPAGRGRRPLPPPVRKLAAELGIPVIQPEKVGSSQAMDTLKAWDPEAIVVAAFGQILPPSVLALPARGCLNVHASLLPRWRGASPIQAAILHGDSETGATIMLMDKGLDTGPILTQRSLSIRPDHTGGTMSAELADLGAALLVETLPRYFAGELLPRPQDDTLATLAPRLTRPDGRLDPNRSADQLQRQVRAYSPWPGTYLRGGEAEVAVLEAHAGDGQVDTAPGTLVEREGQPCLVTPSGWLVLDRLQLPGRRATDGPSFLRGQRRLLGTRFT
jgi:methionyl-tRNA formyltransferase